jgi:hypothetical protein
VETGAGGDELARGAAAGEWLAGAAAGEQVEGAEGVAGRDAQLAGVGISGDVLKEGMMGGDTCGGVVAAVPAVAPDAAGVCTAGALMGGCLQRLGTGSFMSSA